MDLTPEEAGVISGMILALNCILNDRAREGFDSRTVPMLAEVAGREIEVAHLVGAETFPTPERFSHLLISGSELSASVPSEYDEGLHRLVRDFIAAERAILGICYGHQVIAKALAGDAVCRRSVRPEFGFQAVRIRENALFAGLVEPIFAHSHYDELCDLPPEFELIADTEHCATQAFQLRGRPVWGVQFHPEMGARQARRMFEENLAADPDCAPFLADELGDVERLAQNRLIFANFFGGPDAR